MTTYRVEPDGADTPTLARYESEGDQYPEALAYLTVSGNTAVRIDNPDHGVVFRAAAAVPAPDEAVARFVAAAIHKESCEECQLQAKAVLGALRQHAEGSAS